MMVLRIPSTVYKISKKAYRQTQLLTTHAAIRLQSARSFPTGYIKSKPIVPPSTQSKVERSYATNCGGRSPV